MSEEEFTEKLTPEDQQLLDVYLNRIKETENKIRDSKISSDEFQEDSLQNINAEFEQENLNNLCKQEEGVRQNPVPINQLNPIVFNTTEKQVNVVPKNGSNRSSLNLSPSPCDKLMLVESPTQVITSNIKKPGPRLVVPTIEELEAKVAAGYNRAVSCTQIRHKTGSPKKQLLPKVSQENCQPGETPKEVQQLHQIKQLELNLKKQAKNQQIK